MYKRQAGSQNKFISVFGLVVATGLILANANSIYGLLATTISFGTTGIIKSPNIEIYCERECMIEVSSIDWGLLEAGDSVSRTLYINNTGNIELSLHLSIEDWTPTEAESYIYISWNCAGKPIQPSEIMAATLTLTTLENVNNVTSFGFSIRIIGTEVTE